MRIKGWMGRADQTTKVKGMFVRPEQIAEVVERWTGIPTSKMLEGEREKLLKMEERLHLRVVGQDEAISVVADAVRRSRAGLQDPRRPIGSFIFLGPTGVGKTEVARRLTEFLFGDQTSLIRIDMSEYMEQSKVNTLIGAAYGYVEQTGDQVVEQTALALTGIFPFAGFWSKDEILADAWNTFQHGGHFGVSAGWGFFVWLLLTIAAFLTAFYTGRQVFLHTTAHCSDISQGIRGVDQSVATAVGETVADDVAFGPRKQGLPEHEVGARVADALVAARTRSGKRRHHSSTCMPPRLPPVMPNRRSIPKCRTSAE